MRPQKLTISGGRRTTVDYDDRSAEYRDYNRNRWKYDRKIKQFYNSKMWRETSKQVLLQSDYVCAMCGREATMTDHIVSVKKDWNNLQASCKACNDSKAIRERCKSDGG